MKELRTALVTGASAGLGAAFARQLAARGMQVILVARRPDRLEALAHELRGTEALVADLTNPADLERAAARAATVDLLVNNAGFGTRGFFWEADLAGQEAMCRLHVIAAMRLCHAALGGMTARGRGGIINVSSVAGFGETPGNVSYCSTKAWMNAFTEGLWMELKSRNSPVRVQALCPGFVLTEFHDVMGVDRGRIPESWWMKADYVVAESLKGLDRNKLFVIPSAFYRAVVLLQKLTPRRLFQAGAIRYSRRAGRI
ncbi:MAG: SDR family NAD(P)-dependent oxidoreductase [Bryobacteraceae bacterium]